MHHRQTSSIKNHLKKGICTYYGSLMAFEAISQRVIKGDNIPALDVSFSIQNKNSTQDC